MEQYNEFLMSARAQGSIPMPPRRHDEDLVGSDNGGDRLMTSDDDDAPLPPPAVLAAAPHDPGAPPLDDDCFVASGGEEHVAPLVVVAGVAPVHHGSSSSSSSSSPTASEADAPAGDDAGLLRDFVADAPLDTVDVVGGEYKVRFDVHVSTVAASRSHSRWYIVCQRHRGCKKRRACGPAQTATLGDHEPQAYLLAWAEEASKFPDARAHVAHTPVAADTLVAYWKFELGAQSIGIGASC